jgi:hypothetical protein
MVEEDKGQIVAVLGEPRLLLVAEWCGIAISILRVVQLTPHTAPASSLDLRRLYARLAGSWSLS